MRDKQEKTMEKIYVTILFDITFMFTYGCKCTTNNISLL